MPAMRRPIIIILCLLSISFKVWSQDNIQEEVYLHVSSQHLITGETIYFSAYCNSALTGRPSKLSKILYVELIGEKGTVFQSKISLENSSGYGEFFISSLVSSGRYQLLAYTRWMKNFGSFSQTPITIINPYEKLEEISPSITEASVSFFPAGGQLVAGVDNTIGFQLNNGSGDLARYKLNIVDESGETALKFQPNNLGIGKIKFTPTPTSKYQLILENPAGQLAFLQFPTINQSGVSIGFDEKRTQLEVSALQYPAQSTTLNLVIKNLNKAISTSSIKANSSVFITKSQLPEGLLTIEIRDNDDQLLASRAYFNQNIEINKKVEKDYFPTRSAASITPVLAAGKYSVSIRKVFETQLPNYSHATISRLQKNISQSTIETDRYFASDEEDKELFLLMSEFRNTIAISDTLRRLPEVREEIITGTIKSKNDAPIDGVTVVLSFPGNPYQLRSDITSKNGGFSIPFESSKVDKQAYLLPFDLSGNYELTVDNPFLEAYPEFDYSIPRLDSSQIVEIVDRSIKNQIQNAYYVIEPAETNTSKWLKQVDYSFFYVLDEYTRFKTVKETFTEYIISTNLRERRDPVFRPFIDNLDKSLSYEPLVIFDGVPIEAEKVLAYSPYKLASIGILNNRSFTGELINDGVVSFQTKEGNLDGFELDDNYTPINVSGLKNKSSFKAPTYIDSNFNPVPDQRSQLFWNPQLTVTSDNPIPINFFTSDLTGAFEMVIEGFTQSGKPVSIVRTFSVEKKNR